MRWGLRKTPRPARSRHVHAVQAQPAQPLRFPSRPAEAGRCRRPGQVVHPLPATCRRRPQSRGVPGQVSFARITSRSRSSRRTMRVRPASHRSSHSCLSSLHSHSARSLPRPHRTTTFRQHKPGKHQRSLTCHRSGCLDSGDDADVADVPATTSDDAVHAERAAAVATMVATAARIRRETGRRTLT